MTLPTYPVMILFDLSRGSNPTLIAFIRVRNRRQQREGEREQNQDGKKERQDKFLHFFFYLYECLLHLEIQWVHEDRITLFTADGLVQIGGSITPRHVSSSDLVWEGLGLGGGTDVRNWGSLVYQAISIANNACWAIGELAVK
ncbi:hypothetical protein HN873_000374, partial [Arachis hypogaea]